MPRRYSFELFYPVERVPAALTAVEGLVPPSRRDLPHASGQVGLNWLSPDNPLFQAISLLVPADQTVRAYHDADDVEPEWTDDGVECLPVGVITLAVRVGAKYGQLTFTAATSSMSDLFRCSPAVWEQFARLLQSSGGLVGIFQGVDHRGKARYPLLPDGREAVELDFFDFVLEERVTYWHLDTDRFAEAVLRAPRIAV